MIYKQLLPNNNFAPWKAAPLNRLIHLAVSSMTAGCCLGSLGGLPAGYSTLQCCLSVLPVFDWRDKKTLKPIKTYFLRSPSRSALN